MQDDRHAPLPNALKQEARIYHMFDLDRNKGQRFV